MCEESSQSDAHEPILFTSVFYHITLILSHASTFCVFATDNIAYPVSCIVFYNPYLRELKKKDTVVHTMSLLWSILKIPCASLLAITFFVTDKIFKTPPFAFFGYSLLTHVYQKEFHSFYNYYYIQKVHIFKRKAVF